MKKEKKTGYLWHTKEAPYTIGTDQFSLCHAKKDIEGWVDASFCRPMPYDLVWIKTDGRTKTGWWDGMHWEGVRLTKEDKILFWKIYFEGRHG